MSERKYSPANSAYSALSQRRASGGARREISTRVFLRADTAHGDGPREPIDGWALNISRGGIRVVIDGRVKLGDVYLIESQESDGVASAARPARVVWCQDEPDGAVVGFEFIDAEAKSKSQ